jgi:hypothetical protein
LSLNLDNGSIFSNILNFEWITDPIWITAIGTIGSTLGAVIIAAYSFYIGRENEKNQGLRYVFQLLDDNGHRNARRRIVNLYGEEDEYQKEKILRLMGLSENAIRRKEAILKESQEIVKADFDQIGSLIKNKEIPKNVFIKIYWHEVLKCWQVLDKDIKKIQSDLNDEKYMENFKHLNNLATKYVKRKKKIKDFTKLVHKDIRVYPLLTINEYDSYTREILIESDEDLNTDTVNHNTIYLVDDNNEKVPSKIEIDYKDENKWIIIRINEKPNDKKCYLYLTKDIRDRYGISLNKPIKSNLPFRFYI